MSFHLQGAEFEYYNPYGALSEATDRGFRLDVQFDPYAKSRILGASFQNENQWVAPSTINQNDRYVGSLPSPPERHEVLDTFLSMPVETAAVDTAAAPGAIRDICSPPEFVFEPSDLDWSGSDEVNFPRQAIYADTIEAFVLNEPCGANSEAVFPAPLRSDLCESVGFPMETPAGNETLHLPVDSTTTEQHQQLPSSKPNTNSANNKQTTKRKARRTRKQYGSIYDDDGKEIIDPVKRSRKRIAMLIEEDQIRRQLQEKERTKIAAARIERASRRAKLMASA